MSSQNNLGSTVLPVRKIQRKHFWEIGKFRKRSFGKEQIKDTRIEQTSEYPWEIIGCSPLPLNLYFSANISMFFNFSLTPSPSRLLRQKKKKSPIDAICKTKGAKSELEAKYNVSKSTKTISANRTAWLLLQDPPF